MKTDSAPEEFIFTYRFLVWCPNH